MTMLWKIVWTVLIVLSCGILGFFGGRWLAKRSAKKQVETIFKGLGANMQDVLNTFKMKGAGDVTPKQN